MREDRRRSATIPPWGLRGRLLNECSFRDLAERITRPKGDVPITLLELPGNRGVLEQLVIDPGYAEADESMYATGNEGVGAECTGIGAIKFNDARLMANGDFRQVEGEISTAGLKITAADYAWQFGTGFTGTLVLRGEAKAALEAGEWKPLTGDLHTLLDSNLPIVKKPVTSFIPLPGGFKLDGFKFHFLNADPDEQDPDAMLKDGTLRIDQSFKGPDEARVEMGIDKYDRKLSMLRVAVANVKLGDTGQGDTWQVGGTGEIAVDGSGSKRLVLDVTCAKGPDELTNNCQVFDHFEVDEFKFYWGDSVMALKADAKVRYSDDRVYGFAINGEYRSEDEWSMRAQNTTPFPIMDDVTLDRISGTLAREIPKDDQGAATGPSQLFAAFTGSLMGLKFDSGIAVNRVTGTLLNKCTVEESNKKCNPGEMRLLAEAEVETVLPTQSMPTTLTAKAQVNLTSLKWTFDVAMDNIKIGPDALNISSASFILSNGSAGFCGPEKDLPEAGKFSIGLMATANVLNAQITLGGGFRGGAEKGQCFFGTRGAMKFDEGMRATDSVITYATYANAKYDLPGHPPKAIPVGKPNNISVGGTWEMSKSVTDFFKITPGTVLYFQADVDVKLNSLAVKVQYDLPEGKQVTMWQTDKSRIGMSGFGFRIAVNTTTGTFELTAFGEAMIYLAGNPDAGIKASETPVGVSLTVSVSREGVGVTVQAGAETQKGDIENAFGQQGLLLKRLSFLFKVAYPVNVELGLNADAMLPKEWTLDKSDNGKAQRATLAFSISRSNFCLLFQLGNADATPSDPDVLNFGNGAVTARYVKLLVAPWGCFVPVGGKDQEWLPKGFGVAFRGAVAGQPVDIVINVGFENGGTQVDGHFRTPRFDLGVIALQSYDSSTGIDILEENAIKRAMAEKYPNSKIDTITALGDSDQSVTFEVEVNFIEDRSAAEPVRRMALGTLTNTAMSQTFKIHDVVPAGLPPNGPNIEFNIDTSQNIFKLGLDAGIEVGKAKYFIGGLVRVKGNISTEGSFYDANLTGSANFKVGPAQLKIEKLLADVHLAKPTASDKEKAGQHAFVEAKVQAGVLGVYIGASGKLAYKGTTLLSLLVTLETGVNLYFGEVKGVAAFNLCAGVLAPPDRSTGLSECKPFAKYVNSTPAYRLSLIGQLRVLWWWDSYSWIPLDHPGTEGQAPDPEPEPEDKYIPGPTPRLTPDLMAYDVISQKYGHDVEATFGVSTTPDYFKAVSPVEINTTSRGMPVTYPACDNVKLGSSWQPTEGNPNPEPDQMSPYPNGCGLLVNRANAGTKKVFRQQVVCTEQECWVPGQDGNYFKIKGNAQEFRDRIIGGLRTPPGVVPAGTHFAPLDSAALTRKGELLSPDGNYQLTYNSYGFNLQHKKDNNWDRLWHVANFLMDYQSHSFTQDGRLHAEDPAKKGRQFPLEPIDVGYQLKSNAGGENDPYLFIQDGMSVYQRVPGSTEPKLQWAVNSLGNCIPDRDIPGMIEINNQGEKSNTCPDPKPKPKPDPTPPPDPDPSYQTKFYTNIKGKNYCLGIAQGQATPGGRLVSWPCMQIPDQVVTVFPNTNKLKMMNLCLQGSPGQYPIVTAECNGSAQQKFTFEEGAHRITSQGQCLDVQGGVGGNPVGLYGCSSAAENQRWYRG